MSQLERDAQIDQNTKPGFHGVENLMSIMSVGNRFNSYLSSRNLVLKRATLAMRNERALGPIILERLSASATRSQMPCLSPILPCARRSRRHASMMIASLS
jgi:hypothetical protein